MAITDIKLSGYIFQDDGDAVNGATVAILETGTTTQEDSTTTNSDGLWTFTETSLDTTYDVKVTSGSSVRKMMWADEIALKGVDTGSLKIRGAASAAAPLYFFADRADDAGDSWRMQATTSDTLTIGSDKASAGTIIDYITITNGANAAASVVALGGNLTVGGDLTISGDDLTMGTNTSTAILVADGTNYNPVVPSGVIDLANNGAFTLDNTVISSQTEITSGLAAADELLYSDGGTVKKVGLDNFIELAPTLATEDAIANGDYILFLDGGATGNMNKEAVADFATLLAGTGISASASVLSIDAAQTGITSIYATDLIMGEDSQTAIDFGTANEIDFKVDNAARLTLTASALYPVTDNQIDLGTSSLEFKDAFFDGTVTADAFAGPLTGDVTGTADVATVATTVTITDNESTNENNAIIFTAGGDVDGGNLGLESDGTLTYNPSTGKITATGFIGNLTGDVTGTADTATVATTVTITDNESTNEDNAIVFTAGGDVDGGNLGLESDGNLIYNPSTGRITATQVAGTVVTATQNSITTMTGLTTTGTIGTGVWEGTDVGVAHGGTGASSLTANGVLIGNGTSAVTAVDQSTKGHILIGDGSGNPQMLAVGNNDQVLTADSGETTGVKWADASGGGGSSTCSFSVYANSTTAAASGTWTKMAWGAEEFDVGNNFASNKFTAPQDGKYIFSYCITWSTMVSGSVVASAIYKNGSIHKMIQESDVDSNINHTIKGTVIIDLDSTDYIEVYGIQGSGGSENMGTSSGFSGATQANSNWFTGSLL